MSTETSILDGLKIRMNKVLSGLSIEGECVNVESHRHLSFFDLKLSPGASIKKIESKVREIALGIHSKTAPIVKCLPQEGIVRLQVAMRSADSVTLESLYADHTVLSDSEHLIPVILGESDHGEKVIVDFAKNPHTLIAGGTGSGKSVLLHNIISNMLYLNAMNLRNIDLYLIDPKQVEFAAYSAGIFKNHVTTVINSYDSTIEFLSFLENEMETRYSLLSEKGFRSLEECPRLFSQIVVVIDEVADLMMQDKKLKRFQDSIVKLAQKARAAGIYIIMATQRPSVDVITGLIKANFPARIACKTASKVDSQVVLDCIGAENLMGRGDAILRNMVYDNTRFQVAFAEPKKTERVLLSLQKKIA